MNENIKELVKRLRESHARVSLFPENRGQSGFMDLLALRNIVPEAALALEAMAWEVKKLRAEFNKLQTQAILELAKTEAERDRLKAALEEMTADRDRLAGSLEMLDEALGHAS